MKDYERLTKYEKIENKVVELLINESACGVQQCIQKLAKLEDKIESGKLVEFPCKVGEFIYVPYIHKGVDGIMKLIVAEIQIAKFQIAYCTDFETDDEGFRFRFNNGIFSLATYQELWFTTKEAAEAKLAELRGEK